MNPNNTAVLLIVFNRIATVSRVFDAIRLERPDRLYIAADGPRNVDGTDIRSCEEVRRYVSNIDWPCDVKYLFRDVNLGCTKSVLSAIDWFFHYEDCGIILEDDCLPLPRSYDFFSYGLLQFRDSSDIFSISGHNFALGESFGRIAPFVLSNIPNIWGWATWRDRWLRYRAQAHSIRLRDIDEALPDDDVKDYWRNCYHFSIPGSWDVHLAVYCIANRLYNLVSSSTAVRNIDAGADFNDKTILSELDFRRHFSRASLNSSKELVDKLVARQFLAILPTMGQPKTQNARLYANLRTLSEIAFGRCGRSAFDIVFRLGKSLKTSL
jgi:hypothetical protein